MRFPFLIIHDPGDLVTSFEGSRNMFDQAGTHHEDKELIEVSAFSFSPPPAHCHRQTPGFLHGILSNHSSEACEMVWNWVNKRHSKRSSERAESK
jgi:hypothetical protein